MEPFARARLRGQGAVSVHTAKGHLHSSEDVTLTIEQGGYLEFLPECRILLPGSDFEQDVRIEVAPGSSAIVADGFVVGGGTDGVFASYVSTLRITSEGNALARETVRLTGGAFETNSLPAHTAHGLVILAAPGFDERIRFDERAAAVSMTSSAGLYTAVSRLPNGAGLAGRIAAMDGRLLRQGVATCVEEFRGIARDSSTQVEV